MICIFLYRILLIVYDNIDIPIKWKKSIRNPILGNKKIGSLFDPFVIKHDNLYKMYVSWRLSGEIALSTSKDGINWSDLKIVLNSFTKFQSY